MMEENRRSDTMDLYKGILVITMILAHCIQFFGEEDKLYQGIYVNFINLITFPGFLFTYGFVCSRAYFDKKFSLVWRKLLINAGRTLFAFYLSSIAYYAFVENKIFRADFLLEVVLVRRFAGWSEFLISFSAVILVGMVMFPLFKRLNNISFFVIAAVSTAACFIPYDKITVSQLALFLGSTNFITFPVVQFLIYFAGGVITCKKNLRFHTSILIGAVITTLPVILYLILKHEMPLRFPPSWIYLWGGSLVVYLNYLLCGAIAKVQIKNRLVFSIREYVKRVGSNSLFYLLISNLLIFSFKGSAFFYKGFGYALGFYIFIMFAINYMTYLLYKSRLNLQAGSIIMQKNTENIYKASNRISNGGST